MVCLSAEEEYFVAFSRHFFLKKNRHKIAYVHSASEIWLQKHELRLCKPWPLAFPDRISHVYKHFMLLLLFIPALMPFSSNPHEICKHLIRSVVFAQSMPEQ
jgi:hypothetical protein